MSTPAHADKDGYVGSAACAGCHAIISANFAQTRMGRSLTRLSPTAVAKLPVPASLNDHALDRQFEVFRENGKLWQRESETGPGGAAIFHNTQEVKWIIGAGANGYSGLVQLGNYLFEAPLSFYSETKHWEPSPGYEREDNGFHRPVLAGCISCHAGRPDPIEQDTGKYAIQPFLQTAIGCENCHGPGAAHVRAMKARKDHAQDTLIVNPDKLSADLENDICMSCHEAGDSRVPRPGKTYQDFRPGMPLDDTLSILMIPLKRDDPDANDHVQHYFEMSMSKCFRATARQLRCATCHDPHIEPTRQNAPAYFNQKCMNCHESNGCKAPLQVREKTTPVDNCIGCHMPQRQTLGIAHTSLTNHRILARPGEPWPEEAFQQTTRELPDLIHLNRVRGRADDLPMLSLLEAYREIAERRPEYADVYQRTLTELDRTDPDHATVQEALGKRELAAGSLDGAVAHLRKAIALNPQDAVGYSLLSEALARENRLDEAIAANQRAVDLEPYDRSFQKSLVEHLIQGKQYDKALAAIEHYLDLFPEDGFMRKMLNIAKE
jgi:Flp pilus assembly protein TadD